MSFFFVLIKIKLNEASHLIVVQTIRQFFNTDCTLRSYHIPWEKICLRDKDQESMGAKQDGSFNVQNFILEFSVGKHCCSHRVKQQ